MWIGVFKVIQSKKIIIVSMFICMNILLLVCRSDISGKPKAEVLTKTEREVLSLTDITDGTDGPGQLYAQAAVLIDGDTGRVLYGKNENEILAMASTTKIMTCILALENSDLQSQATVSSYAASMPEVALGLSEGQVCTIENLLYSLMLESHNDTAVVIAEHVGGTVENFAKMMNDKAKEIGCTSTYFVTPNGLDGESMDANSELRAHGTTAKELALIMRYCMKISKHRDEFIQITTTPSWQFNDVSQTFTATLTNHNAFLTMMDGASAGKTGFTNKAGYCYVGSLVDDGRTYIAALLACGWPNNKSYKWSDMKKLMTYGRDNYVLSVIDANLTLEPVEVMDGVGDIDHLHRPSKMEIEVDTSVHSEPMKVLLKNNEKVTISYNIADEVQAPVSAGQMAGTVIFSIDDIKLREYPVVFKKGIDRISMEWCVERISDIFINP